MVTELVLTFLAMCMQPQLPMMAILAVPFENVSRWQAKVLGSKHESQEVGWPVVGKRFLRIFLSRPLVTLDPRSVGNREDVRVIVKWFETCGS